MQEDTINLIKKKKMLLDTDIDFLFSGDLINQEIVSTFVMRKYDIPYVGLFGACSTFGICVITESSTTFIPSQCSQV